MIDRDHAHDPDRGRGDEPEAFDPRQEIGEGITLLEASAGTGKTHAVASLVVAEVAAGRPLEDLLIVTFTRKATGTLRERVWQRLSAAAAALAPGAAPPDDGLLAHLRATSDEEVDNRRWRLEQALADFDAATIATTHGFCQHVLANLGVAGDAEPGLELVEQVGNLVTDAVDDLFVRRFHAGGDVLFNRAAAVRIADAVVAQPDCRIAPVDDGEADRLRRQFALTLRGRIIDQKRRRRIITYDDLLSRLDESLGDDARGTIVAERLRRRYRMTIVDEFQDTDSVQWRILRQAFGAPPSRLVLVGDPKQAIYSFRGGDVFAYLQATGEAGTRRSLPISWRADQPLLDAIDAVLGGAQLGHPSIRHRPLRARPGAERSALGGPATAPLTVRVADRDRQEFTLTSTGLAEKAAVRRFIAADLASVVVRMLRSGTTIDDRPVGPGDVAVLTRTRQAAETTAAALLAAGVPAVVHGGASVFSTDAAGHWLELLRALERPSSEARVNALACGPFIGWDATRLDGAGEAERESLDSALHDWAAALRVRSVPGLLRRIEATHHLTARLCGQTGGERQLADLRHIAELLHGRLSDHPGSVTGLARWLAEQIGQADTGGPDSERRRLGSDAEAVAIHTIHGAKGLEFPIVLLPCVWDAPPIDESAPPVFHDTDGRRAIGVGQHGPLHEDQLARAAEERDQEDLRLLYVALTRARHQVVLWWASAFDSQRSAFARILLGRAPDGTVARRLDQAPSEASIVNALQALAIPVRRAGATGEVHEVDPVAPAELAVRRFERTFDRHWTRTSYTGLTRAAHDRHAPAATTIDRIGSDERAGGDATGGELRLADPTERVEVDERAKVDEPEVPAAPAPAGTVLAVPLPLGALPGGPRVGTLVHDVLERTDFAAVDLTTELARASAGAGARRVLAGHADVLVAGLALAVETPLGPCFDGRRLRDLTRADRRDELSFDLPLAGGDDPRSAPVTMEAIAGAFAALPGHDPLAGYHERLRDPLLVTAVRGFLTGSIDLVGRVGGRYVVVDYKTNRLAPPDEAPLAWHYRPEALTEAMQQAHYPLQAAFYAVALHRFLRWRLGGYRPDQHLGGVAYLFLKGMIGADTPVVDGSPCGVFSWNPPAAFVLGLSDVLDGGRP